MVLCRVIRTSAATPVHYLGSVQVNANRLRLLHFNLTCSLRNNTTTRLPLCFSNVSSGYAYHTACTPSLHTGEGREKNRNIFTDYSNVEIGELGHSKRAYISDIAQGPCNYAKCKSLSSPFWLTGSSSRKISGLTELESLLFSSRAKVPAAWLSSVQVRTASSAAAQPKTDDRDDKQTEARQTEVKLYEYIICLLALPRLWAPQNSWITPPCLLASCCLATLCDAVFRRVSKLSADSTSVMMFTFIIKKKNNKPIFVCIKFAL